MARCLYCGFIKLHVLSSLTSSSLLNISLKSLIDKTRNLTSSGKDYFPFDLRNGAKLNIVYEFGLIRSLLYFYIL